MRLIKEEKTTQTIAAELEVPEDLLLIEIEDYGKLHPDYILHLPRTPRGNYLKNFNNGSF